MQSILSENDLKMYGYHLGANFYDDNMDLFPSPEYKILNLVKRQTLGFKRFSFPTTIENIAKKTGLSSRSAQSALRFLLDLKIVLNIGTDRKRVLALNGDVLSWSREKLIDKMKRFQNKLSGKICTIKTQNMRNISGKICIINTEKNISKTTESIAEKPNYESTPKLNPLKYNTKLNKESSLVIKISNEILTELPESYKNEKPRTDKGTLNLIAQHIESHGVEYVVDAIRHTVKKAPTKSFFGYLRAVLENKSSKPVYPKQSSKPKKNQINQKDNRSKNKLERRRSLRAVESKSRRCA